MIVLTGGSEISKELIHSFSHPRTRWAGIDRGTVNLLNEGITPEAAFGDFDSVTQQEWNLIEKTVNRIDRANPEKNMTDMEMALEWALDQQEDIVMIGVTGGRLDHFFGNIQLLLHDKVRKYQKSVKIMDDQNLISIHDPGEILIDNDHAYRYISVIPFSASIEGLTLIGVKYPLKDHRAVYGSTLTISNEIIEDHASISFQSGILMIVRSKDQ
ncbi:thiamine diphosphokinase [Jeotgalibacillus sp. R-1-5s-1]|uniref:thiamine diphosphokinase n=1 Tax=Jeotgalibacillus sp. R-1-5s-1 TaxID=2555897 RepID=UPI00106C773F|nr:thiamine diphosphokinase [Jeotgalibacillus sp. R-1-5s-1]TFE03537.1 thiamine diphosphokinase [Jeotgalibacillus sp. R-1-5s-1]